MYITALKPSVYPVDSFQVHTVLCIGIQDQTSDVRGIDVDIIVNRHFGCATHRVITSIITDQGDTNLPASVISCQFQIFDRREIKSVKIGTLGSLETVEEVQTFLQNIVNKKYPVIVNLNSVNQREDDVLQATIDSILPFCSILIITYDIIIRLCISQQQSIQDVANILLKMDSKAIIVHDENGQRYIVGNDDDKNEELRMKYILLSGRCPASSLADFSAVIAAYLTHENLPLNIAICYSHLYSTGKELIHSPFLFMSTLSFTQGLWSLVDGIYNRMLKLPFLNKMLDDTLDERIYDYYIIQDYYFFIDRGHMLKGLIDQCTNDEEVRQFFNIQFDKNNKYVQTILSENNLAPCNEDIIKKMPACMNYTKLMLELGRCRRNFSWIKGLIALLPCTLVYAKLGDWMIASGMCSTVKRYANFIDTYRDQARRDRLVYFLELTNRVVNNCSYEQREKLKEIFQKVCEYEYAFWDDAYQYGTQKIDEMMKNNLKIEQDNVE